MRWKIVTIEIDEQGNSSLDLDGFAGRGCGDVAKDFQGPDAVVEVRTKRDYYVAQPARMNLKQESRS